MGVLGCGSCGDSGTASLLGWYNVVAHLLKTHLHSFCVEGQGVKNIRATYNCTWTVGVLLLIGGVRLHKGNVRLHRRAACGCIWAQ